MLYLNVSVLERSHDIIYESLVVLTEYSNYSVRGAERVVHGNHNLI